MALCMRWMPKVERCVWRYETGDWVSSPVVSDGVVYVGSVDGFVYALDAESGALRWRYETDSWVSSPVIFDGVVYVRAGDGFVYALGTGGDSLGSPGTEPNEGEEDREAISLSISECSSTPNSATGLATIRISGAVYANRPVSSLTVTGTANGYSVGSASRSTLAAGSSWSFSMSTDIPAVGSAFNCSVEVEYSDAGRAKMAVGAVESATKKIRVRGSVSSASALLNRRRFLDPLHIGE